MEVSGRHYAPAALLLRKLDGTHSVEVGCVPGGGLGVLLSVSELEPRIFQLVA
jgi:hypothetical protein